MKTVKESYLILSSILLLLVMIVLLLLAPAAQGQTQFSSYPLLSNGAAVGTNANLLVNVVDGTSATGFRTKRMTIAALLDMLGAQISFSVTTNTVTNRYEFYTTNIYEPATEIFSNWLQGVTIHDRWEFYPTNLYAGIAVCNLSNLLNPVLTPDGVVYFPTNLYQSDPTIAALFGTNFFDNPTISNYFTINAPVPCTWPTNTYATNIVAVEAPILTWLTDQLMVTNEYAGYYFASNQFAPVINAWVIDTTISNWFATTAPIVMGENTNFYGSNIFNLDEDYISNWFNFHLLATNPCAAAFYASNSFSPVEITHIDTTISNWFYTNATIVMQEYTNFAITNIYTGISNWVTELMTTNGYASNFYETNLWFPTIVYSNTYTTNVQIIHNGDDIFRGPVTITNVWIIGTNNVNYMPVTNLLVFMQGAQMTNLWAGPTNLLDLRYGWLKYIANTPCQVTGITNKVRVPYGIAAHSLLTITNASSSNITIYVPGFATGDGARSYIITNGTRAKLSFEWDPNGDTNLVFRLFY